MFLIEWFDIVWFWLGRICGGTLIVGLALAVLFSVLEWIDNTARTIVAAGKKFSTWISILLSAILFMLVCLLLAVIR